MKETIRKHIISWVDENIYSLANIDDLTKVLGYSRRTIENWFKQERAAHTVAEFDDKSGRGS